MTLAELKTAIEIVIDYNWSDEERDFKEQKRLGEPTDQHIFRTLQKLDRFITEN